MTAIQRLRDTSTRLLENARSQGRRPGHALYFGREDAPSWVCGAALATFLRALNAGATPDAAYEQAVAWSHEMVAQWNAAHEWRLHLAQGAAEPTLLHALHVTSPALHGKA